MSRVLLITFIDFGVMQSGSSVRPQRMYAAFKELGYEVNLLSGLQNRKRERWGRVFRKYREIRQNLPDFCYIEPPSGPFFNFCDHLLLLYLHRKKVPMGIFYRDAYWKFADWWQIKGLKRFFLTKMHQFDMMIFKKTCKIIYFPTQSMADLFDLPHKGILPPAGFDFVTGQHPVTGDVLYIGGVSFFYGTDIMLRAFERINETLGRSIRLTVVCREKEMQNFFDAYQGRPWLKIEHASGDEQLGKYYERCDLAIYPSRKDRYMDFCMPVKLFEYLSRGLPVVATNCFETARFVEKNGFGVVAECTPESISEKVVMLFDNPELLHRLRENAVAVLRQGNLWQHRAQKVAQEIMGAPPIMG